MSSDEKVHPESEPFSDIILEFRKSLGLTQAQFATAAGITSTTVYRYEAGTNFPTNDVLAKLLQLAVKNQALKAVESLGKLLSERSALFLMGGNDQPIQTNSPIHEAISKLPLDKQLEIMAAVLMLEDGQDSTALRMFKNLIEPWISKATGEFAPTIMRSEFSGKVPKASRPKKERR